MSFIRFSNTERQNWHSAITTSICGRNDTLGNPKKHFKLRKERGLRPFEKCLERYHLPRSKIFVNGPELSHLSGNQYIFLKVIKDQKKFIDQ